MRRTGFSLVEVVIVAFIAGTAMVFVLNLGQSNVLLSQINQESLLARQVAMDLTEYYASHFVAADLASSEDPQPPGFLAQHPAFRDTIPEDMRPLFEKMKPQVFVRVARDVEFPAGSQRRFNDLHRVTCTVRWQEGGGRKGPKEIAVTRLVPIVP